MSIEPEFWEALAELAEKDGATLSRLIAGIDSARGNTGLSQAIRLYVLRRLRAKET